MGLSRRQPLLARRAEHVAHQVHQHMRRVALWYLQQRVLTALVRVADGGERMRPEHDTRGMIPGRELVGPRRRKSRRVGGAVEGPRVVDLVAQHPVVCEPRAAMR